MNLKSCYIIGNLFFFTLCSLRAQEASVIKIDEPLAALSSTHTKHQTAWLIVASPKMGHAIKFDDQVRENTYSAEIELQRRAGRWHNAIGVNPFEESIYAMQAWEILEGKFPIGISAYGEYSLEKHESFVSVGPQLTIGSPEKVYYCIIRLHVGSPVEEFKAAAGVQFIIPFAKKL